MGQHETTWQYHVKEVYDGTNDAGDEDTRSCHQCGQRIETTTARIDGKLLCADCASAGEAKK